MKPGLPQPSEAWIEWRRNGVAYLESVEPDKNGKTGQMSIPRSAKPLVLVVEDEPLVRMEVADSLDRAGFAVLQAGDAAQALSLLDQHAGITILFTDIDMPGDIDGLRLADMVRQRHPRIKIAITSGHNTARIAAANLPGPFFPKPYDARSLADRLRAMIAA